eukprot:jgi/Mesen1/10175/ME000076S09690
MTLFTLFQAVLLIVNGLAVLNEDRFLSPYGWGFNEMANGRVSSLKVQIIGLLHAVQYLRVPLVVVNIFIIILKLLPSSG